MILKLGEDCSRPALFAAPKCNGGGSGRRYPQNTATERRGYKECEKSPRSRDAVAKSPRRPLP